MIDIVAKTQGEPICGMPLVILDVRVNGKPRVRTFYVVGGELCWRDVSELRQVGRRMLRCRVRDDFLRRELAVIAYA